MRILTFCVLYCTVLPCYSWSLCGNCCEYKPNQIIAAYSIEPKPKKDTNTTDNTKPKNDNNNTDNNIIISNIKNNKIYFIVNKAPFETLLVKNPEKNKLNIENFRNDVKQIKGTAFVDGTTSPTTASFFEYSGMYIHLEKRREAALKTKEKNQELFSEDTTLKKGNFFTFPIEEECIWYSHLNKKPFYFFEKVFFGSYLKNHVEDEDDDNTNKQYLITLLNGIYDEAKQSGIKYLFIPIDFFDGSTNSFKYSIECHTQCIDKISEMDDVTIIFIFQTKKSEFETKGDRKYFSNMIVHKDKFIKSMTDKLRENNTVTKIKHDKCFYIDNNTE